MRLRGVMLGFGLALMASSGVLQAQASLTPCTTYSLEGIGFAAYLLTANKRPLNITVKSTYEQTLPDGNRISVTAVTHAARDSAGRTMSERVSRCRLNDKGEAVPIVNVQVSDPVAKTNAFWMLNDTATEQVQLRHGGVENPEVRAPVPSPEQAAGRRLEMERAKLEIAQEDLGTKRIAGVEAKGIRVTRTYSAEEVGGTQPFVVKTETWRGPDASLLPLMTIHEDPRTGRTSSEVIEMDEMEPDAAVFAAPKGWPVSDFTTRSKRTPAQ